VLWIKSTRIEEYPLNYFAFAMRKYVLLKNSLALKSKCIPLNISSFTDLSMDGKK